MKISLIIPVYNVENYLDRCLQSVENQTYKEAEVIIVNDGSTDDSYKIIDKFVARNGNFITYKTENNGLGGARNYGLTKATGEYVIFLDSDDYIAEDCIEKFITAAEQNNSDIVICNICDVSEDGQILRYSIHNKSNLTTSLCEAPDILRNRFCAWGKMYRKSLFEGLEYVAREWYEDLRLTPKLYLRAEKITFIDDFLFFYVQRAGSIMNNSKALRNLEIIDAFEDLISYYKENGYYRQFKEEFDYLIVEHLQVATVTRVAMSRAPERKAVLEKLQEYTLQFKDLYNNKYMASLDFNKKLILFFNRKKLYFLTYLCIKAKKALSKK